MRHSELRLAFSISCTSRQPRGTEQNGVEYFFITPEEFRRRIDNGEFLEYEEVYKDRFYGTLKEQVERQSAQGDNVVFDVDVKGGCNIKKYYGSRALSIFIQPPSIDELRRRLEGRGTDAPEVIDDRIARAEFELTFAGQFDRVVVNDDLQKAEEDTLGEDTHRTLRRVVQPHTQRSHSHSAADEGESRAGGGVVHGVAAEPS